MKTPTKWSVIGRDIENKRFELLGEFLKAKGFENELTLVKATDPEFKERFSELLKANQCVRIEKPFYALVAKTYSEFPMEIGFVNYSDLIVKSEGHWWLKSLLSDALGRLIVESKLKYNPTGNVLVVGTGSTARACVYGLARLGFLSIGIVGRNFDAAKTLIGQMKNYLFKINFEAIPVEKISIIPPRYSLVVNTTPETEENLLLKEVSFFNFLTEPAILIDLNLEKSSKSFLGLSQDLNVHRFGGEHIDDFRDLVWLERVFGLKADLSDIKKALSRANV